MLIATVFGLVYGQWGIWAGRDIGQLQMAYGHIHTTFAIMGFFQINLRLMDYHGFLGRGCPLALAEGQTTPIAELAEAHQKST